MPSFPHLISLPAHRDARGVLSVLQAGQGQLPFVPQRVFWISQVPAGAQRGCHAHRTSHEVLIPLVGALTATLHNGREACTLRLDTPTQALYIPAMTWCAFSDFTTDCLCLCVTSDAYTPEGYLNTFSDFLQALSAE